MDSEKRLKLIEDWHKKNLKCRICGETRSVKYEATIVTAQNLDGEKAHICNKCALVYPQNIVKLLQLYKEIYTENFANSVKAKSSNTHANAELGEIRV